ncbi:sushi, nidogen and EGF-like domain-containing protein 1 [Labeo rohita]|uniref:sushi, nidogen and EGF-like domain-containing protein 1 n=1 Tax=Labeo rohita TaxID=84645 RepID=UPI0021E2B045|nr:sushi, nidogen and EGF-like domain-containing protein 1 [Labeo rohita]
MRISQHLLVFISVLSLTRAQTAIVATALESTIEPAETPITLATTSAAEPWRAPDIFYPFGLAAGDTEIVETGSESYSSVGLSTPFQFFGRTYNQIHVNYNGLLTFNIPLLASEPYYNPTRGIEDFIAALWNDFDDYGLS